jgi:hypothetical protein
MDTEKPNETAPEVVEKSFEVRLTNLEKSQGDILRTLENILSVIKPEKPENQEEKPENQENQEAKPEIEKSEPIKPFWFTYF